MEIGQNLKAQLEEILRRKGVGSTPERLGELALELQKRGRAAPCRYFSALVPGCKLGCELDCLNCPQYVPHESSGPLPQRRLCRRCQRERDKMGEEL